MALSDTDDDALEDNEFDDEVDADADADGDADGDIDEELMEAINDVDEATEEGDEDTTSGGGGGSDDSDNDDEDGSEAAQNQMAVDPPPIAEQSLPPAPPVPTDSVSTQSQAYAAAPSPPRVRKRSLSPATKRKQALVFPLGPSAPTYRSCVVEAVCALPHPVPIHALASSYCLSHLLTGADDGYIRNYDIFPAVNGKNFLTAPQRHHAGVVEGILKSGQLRFWWENPTPPNPSGSSADEESSLSSVTSLAMHSDALWALAGSENGAINLFTVRHDPGTLCYTMQGHRRPVSALALDHDEKSFFSAGWDGDAIHWDLNTGQRTRTFTAHGAQLTAIAVRPMNVVQPTTSSSNFLNSDSLKNSVGVNENPATDKAPPQSSAPEGEGGSDDGSFDDLFDEPEGPPSNTAKASSSFVTGPLVATAPQIQQQQRPNIGGIAPPKNAPPLLTSDYYSIFSPDTLMTAAIDGQVVLWDKRVNTPGAGVGRLWMNEKTPPWCLSACWSPDGGRIYAGRRNGSIDVWDVRQLGRSAPSNTPRLLKTLRNPASSGVVSCVVAFPDNKHIACASIDNLRLWNVDAVDSDSSKPKSGVQFKIIPGHHGGYISNLLVDPGCRFLVSASSNRGWHGESTRTVFVHDIKHVP